MKILHTSDWHLGQNFYGKSREREHRAFLAWLVETIQTQQIDALIVAGDIFDIGTPPSYARKLYHDFIEQISSLNCQLVLMGGNHDSVATLDESAHLLTHFATHVIAGVKTDVTQQLVILQSRQSPTEYAIVCGIPYIRPRDVLQSQVGQGASEKQQALMQGMKQHFEQVHQAALNLRAQFAIEQQIPEAQIPIIATGHLTTVANSGSDSVRDIYVGTLESFPADYLPAVDYVALGHIHRAMKVAGHEHIRYSGSPLHLSFDELRHEKQVYLLEFNPLEFAQEKPLSVTSLPLPRFHQLFHLQAPLAELAIQLKQIDREQRALNNGFAAWVSVIVENDDFQLDLTTEVAAIVEDLQLELLTIRRAKNAQTPKLQVQTNEALADLKPEQVFGLRLQQTEIAQAQQEILTQLFAQVHQDIQQLEKGLGEDVAFQPTLHLSVEQIGDANKESGDHQSNHQDEQGVIA